jgi:hypothetical protein
MDSPPFLLDQYARQRGLSASMAKRAIMLQGYAAEGRKLADSATAAGMSVSSAKRIARKLILDFADYRPYAKLEEKGEPRPEPYFRADRPAHELPLFGA